MAVLRGLASLPAVATVQELAGAVRLHPRTVARMARAGRMPAYQLGRRVRVPTTAEGLELLERLGAVPLAARRREDAGGRARAARRAVRRPPARRRRRA